MKKSEEQTAQIKRLQQKILQKDEKIREVLIKIDSMEQVQYENDVQLVGLPEPVSETNDVTQILNLAHKQMGIDITQNDIVETTRLGRKTSSKPRDLLVKFKNKEIRNSFHEQRKKTAPYKKTEENVYINDHLTRHRKELFYSAQHLFKRKKIAAAWTQQGNVLIREKVNGAPKQIFCLKDIERFNLEGTPEVSDSEDRSTQHDDGSITTHTISDYDYSDFEF